MAGWHAEHEAGWDAVLAELMAFGGADPSDVPECEHEERHEDASYLPALERSVVLGRLVERHQVQDR